jgi:hypothetical protein
MRGKGGVKGRKKKGREEKFREMKGRRRNVDGSKGIR